MTTETVSPDIPENTRKTGASIESDIRQRLAEVTQTHAAACMGVSGSTVSRMLEDLTKLGQLLAALGLVVAPADAMVISQQELSGLRHLAFKYLQATLEKDRIREGR